jgi:hypothetical protein
MSRYVLVHGRLARRRLLGGRALFTNPRLLAAKIQEAGRE